MESVTKPTVDANPEAILTAAKRLVVLKAILDANKPLYEEMEKLTLQLRGAVGTGSVPVAFNEEESMFLHNGEAKFVAPNQIVTIVDNFSEKNTVFRPAAVKRFEASIQTMEEYLAKQEKLAKKGK